MQEDVHRGQALSDLNPSQASKRSYAFIGRKSFKDSPVMTWPPSLTWPKSFRELVGSSQMLELLRNIWEAGVNNSVKADHKQIMKGGGFLVSMAVSHEMFP